MTIGFYAAVTLAVLTTSHLVHLDWHVALSKPYKRWPHAHTALDVFVVAGQRGPSALVALCWLGWRTWRTRSPRPLLVLGVALVLLNLSVGAVKLATGRLGPHYAQTIGSAELFSGGLIYPSGHTANGVVTWGTVAYLAVRHRRAKAVVAGVVAFTIGLTTIYLGTHWVSDVLGGWAAGGLVLLALPLLEPVVAVLERGIRNSLNRPCTPFASALSARADGPPRIVIPRPQAPFRDEQGRLSPGGAPPSAPSLMPSEARAPPSARGPEPRPGRGSAPGRTSAGTRDEPGRHPATDTPSSCSRGVKEELPWRFEF